MIASSLPDFFWKTKVTTLKIDHVELKLESLQSLESTIDDLFDYLQDKGHTDLLEVLCPYFGCVWPSSVALTQYVVDKIKNEIEPKQSLKNVSLRVGEVGCGLALPSLLLSKLLPLSKFFTTDFHPEVPVFLEKNKKNNFISDSHLKYQPMDWKLLSEVSKNKMDWVMGSDLLYEKEHPLLLADAVHHWVKHDGTIFISDPGRPYLQEFVDQMKSRGWVSPHLLKDNIFIFEFKKIKS